MITLPWVDKMRKLENENMSKPIIWEQKAWAILKAYGEAEEKRIEEEFKNRQEEKKEWNEIDKKIKSDTDKFIENIIKERELNKQKQQFHGNWEEDLTLEDIKEMDEWKRKMDDDEIEEQVAEQSDELFNHITSGGNKNEKV